MRYLFPLILHHGVCLAKYFLKFGKLEKNVTKQQRQRSLDRQGKVFHYSAEARTLASSHLNVSDNQPMIAPLTVIPHASSYLRLVAPLWQSLPSTSSRDDSSRHPIGNFRDLLSYVIQTVTKPSPTTLLLSIMWLYFSGSFFFDLAHWTLHKFAKSKSPILRKIGYLHEVHHLYFNRRLKFNDHYRWQNMCYELPLELSCQLFGTWLGYVLANTTGFTGPALLSKEILVLVLIFEIIRSFVVACMEGRDSNHKSYSTVVPQDPHSFLVGPEYHALHHVDPTSYIGSTFKVFDWFLGTSCSLKSRRVTIVGSLGVFGAALREQLLEESVSCVEKLSLVSSATDDGYPTMIELLSRTDILIFDSESERENVIGLFKKHHKAKAAQSLLLPEVWQCTSSFKKGSAEHTKRLHDDEDILFRQIDCHTERKWLEVRPEIAAKLAIWWIRRGVRSVPATFDFLAFFEYMAPSRKYE
jgi:hypothetical protein